MDRGEKSMNANELAEILEDVGMEQKHYDTIQKVATMLRQQQAEIEALKAKTLTDDEIIEIWCVMETDTGKQNIDFARAILRKAQNKWTQNK